MYKADSGWFYIHAGFLKNKNPHRQEAYET